LPLAALCAGLTLDREVFRLRDHLAGRFADLCYNGFWYSPEMDFILSGVQKSQEVRQPLATGDSAVRLGALTFLPPCRCSA